MIEHRFRGSADLQEVSLDSYLSIEYARRMAPERSQFEDASTMVDDVASQFRNVNDPKTLRALTHPVRLALLEALALEGPLTATAAGELIGESPTTCSFHFRQLAKYGFVEEAESGPGRLRPWKLVNIGMRFTDVSEDPEMSVAAKGFERMVLDRAMSRLSSSSPRKRVTPRSGRKPLRASSRSSG